MKLSKQNYDSLDENFLYKKEPTIDTSYYVGHTPGTYHCKNWTFTCFKKDGRAIMRDTYWSSGDSLQFEVTDDNIKDFEKIFDFREVHKIRDCFVDEYEKEDLFYAATDSGGYSCGGLYWVKNNAIKSNKLLIEKKKNEIASLERNLRWAKEELIRLEAVSKSKENVSANIESSSTDKGDAEVKPVVDR